MKKSIKGKIKLGAVVVSMATVIVALGFGCGVGFQVENIGTSTLGSITGGDEISDNGNLSIVSGTQTVATVYYNQALENMKSVAGLDQVSDDTLERFDEKVGAFADNGQADLINAPKVLGLTTVGGEVCADLMRSEYDIAQDQRRIFNAVDFGQEDVDSLAVADMVRRMARSFWGRNETAEELAMIQTTMSEISGLANDGGNNQTIRGDNYERNAARISLATCAVMISSTSGMVL